MLCIMTDSMLLGFLTSILCIDAILVVACRLRMNISLAFVRFAEAGALLGLGVSMLIGSNASVMQSVWFVLASFLFLYNTWFVFATDDDLCMGGSVGRRLLNTAIAMSRLSVRLNKSA